MTDNFDIETIVVSEEETAEARANGKIIVTEDSGIKCTFSYWNGHWYIVDIEEEDYV